MSSFAWNVTGATLGAMLLPLPFQPFKGRCGIRHWLGADQIGHLFVQNLLRRSKIDVTLHAFILSIVRISLIVLLALTCLQILGFEITHPAHRFGRSRLSHLPGGQGQPFQSGGRHPSIADQALCRGGITSPPTGLTAPLKRRSASPTPS